MRPLLQSTFIATGLNNGRELLEFSSCPICLFAYGSAERAGPCANWLVFEFPILVLYYVRVLSLSRLNMGGHFLNLAAKITFQSFVK